MCTKPSYDGFDRIFDFYEYKTITINLKPENNYKMTLEDVKLYYEEGVKAILIPNPSNPVCNYISTPELEKIIKFCIKKDMYIIYDAIFEESPCFYDGRVNIFNLSNNYPKLIKVKGLSKDTPNLSDFRCGWTICKDKMFNELLLAINSATTFSNPTFLEDIEIVEMQNRVNVDKGNLTPEVENYLKEKEHYHRTVLHIFSTTYEYLFSNLDVVEYIYYPDAGNMMYITLNKEKCNAKGVFTSHELTMKVLNDENILITPGHCFGAPLNDLSFRVTISRNLDDFLSGIRRIVELFK